MMANTMRVCIGKGSNSKVSLARSHHRVCVSCVPATATCKRVKFRWPAAIGGSTYREYKLLVPANVLSFVGPQQSEGLTYRVYRLLVPANV